MIIFYGKRNRSTDEIHPAISFSIQEYEKTKLLSIPIKRVLHFQEPLYNTL